MNRHLSKPFKPRELTQVIAETLRLQVTPPAKAFISPPPNDWQQLLSFKHRKIPLYAFRTYGIQFE